MKIQRWYVGEWNYHGAPNDLGKWCASSDVTNLEISHAKLLEVLKDLVSESERNQYGGGSPSPEDVRGILAKSPVMDDTPALIAAKAAIAKAEGVQP